VLFFANFTRKFSSFRDNIRGCKADAGPTQKSTIFIVFRAAIKVTFFERNLEKQGQGRRPPNQPVQSALSSAFMVKNAFKKLEFNVGQDLTIIGSCNLNVMFNIELNKIKVVYGLVKNMKGYYIHICLSSNSTIKRLWRLCRFSPLLLLVDYPIWPS
jgi:hypothetical protein